MAFGDIKNKIVEISNTERYYWCNDVYKNNQKFVCLKKYSAMLISESKLLA